MYFRPDPHQHESFAPGGQAIARPIRRSTAAYCDRAAEVFGSIPCSRAYASRPSAVSGATQSGRPEAMDQSRFSIIRE
jgi:hypothetical protein